MMSTVTLPNGTVLVRLTREKVLSLIRAIPLGVIPYNQGKLSTVTDKRSDCTGLTSYCWDTPDAGPGIYLKAYNTGSFFTAMVLIRIGWDDLLPGDTIGYFAPNSPGNGGHAAIWMGGAKDPGGTFDVWDHGSGMGPKRRLVKWNGTSTGWLHPDKLLPWRYVGIIEADGTTYQPGQSLLEDDVTLICKMGDKGPQVKRAQDKMRQVDPSLPPNFADSQYGPGTRDTHARLANVADGTKYTTGDEAHYNTILLQRDGTGGGVSVEQAHEIARAEISVATVTVPEIRVSVETGEK